MASRWTYLCVNDRIVTKGPSSPGMFYGVQTPHLPGSTICPVCHEDMKAMGFRWRPPKKSNKKAWKMIESGKYLWDKPRTFALMDSRKATQFRYFGWGK